MTHILYEPKYQPDKPTVITSDYDAVKDLPYKKQSLGGTGKLIYKACRECDIELKDGNYCRYCGGMIMTYRSQHICNDCKTTFKGFYCPNCGKGECWEQEHRKKEEEERKRESRSLFYLHLITFLLGMVVGIVLSL